MSAPVASSLTTTCFSDRIRIAVYAVVILALGSWTCFHHLDRGMLIDDESAFGITTDLMLETGDWVVPYLGDGVPHLNATPLYNWLCCLTADCFGDRAARYRAWSGAFAILCALAVLVLGAELFRPEVGFLAGLLMLINQSFLFVHAARSGVMEPATAMFLVLMTYCYVRTSRPNANALRWWALVGASLGGAVMMKPPAMGGFFFILIGLHHLFARRDLPLLSRFTRPLLALGVAFLIALPWYGLIAHRIGFGGLKQLFYTNSVGRMLPVQRYVYTPPPYWVYLDFLKNSAWSAVLFWPAVVVGALCSALGWMRSGWWLPTLLAGGYTLVISLATVKNPHYVYCAFPFICLLTAAMLLAGFLPRPEAFGNGRFAVGSWRLLAVLGLIASILFVRADIKDTRRWLRFPRWEYPPLVIHRVVEPGIVAGRAHLVLYRYPKAGEHPNNKLGFGTIDAFYLPRLKQAERVKGLGGIKRILDEGKPTVVFLPPKLSLTEIGQIWFTTRPDRVIRLRTERFYYTVLTYHGAEAQFELTEFFRRNEVPQHEPDRF